MWNGIRDSVVKEGIDNFEFFISRILVCVSFVRISSFLFNVTPTTV